MRTIPNKILILKIPLFDGIVSSLLIRGQNGIGRSLLLPKI